ncbi:MAG: hypothetical protein JSR61_13375 [Proteobacteria bacterium]|nr:hypothetical protein [Pseudomonadota bacterium]
MAFMNERSSSSRHKTALTTRHRVWFRDEGHWTFNASARQILRRRASCDRSNLDDERLFIAAAGDNPDRDQVCQVADLLIYLKAHQEARRP